MKYTCTALSIGLILSLSSLTSHAADTPTAAEPPELSASDALALVPDAPQPASAPAPSSGRQVPKLVVRWDCGSCDHNEKVPPLLQQSWTKEAAAHGYAVSESETAEMVITEYNQRSPGLRVMFGAMAGQDKLGTRIKFRGKEFKAEDYFANAFSGMNALCANVAKKGLEQLIAAQTP